MENKQKKILDANQRLGELLQVKRTPENQAKVDLIIKQQKDTIKRVELIEDLDRESKEKRLSAEDINTGASQKKDFPIKDSEPTSLLKFLFGTRKNLSAFAERTGVISPKLFGTQYALSDSAVYLFKRFSYKDLAIIIKKIKPDFVFAWKRIPILNYNVLNIFNNSLNGYYHICASIQNGNREINDLLKIGNKFFASLLTLEQDNTYIKLLYPNLEKVFADSENHSYLSSLIKLSDLFFQQNKNKAKVSFREVLLGMYSAKNRRLLKIEEIDFNLGIRRINEREYDAPPDQKIKIKQYFGKIQNDFDKMDEDLFRIKVVKNELLTLNKEGKFVFPIFKNTLTKVFQESGVFDDKLNNELKRVMSNAHLLIKEMLSYFWIQLAPMLNQKISILRGKRRSTVRIFAENLFENELLSFNSLLTEIDRFVKKFPNFEYSVSDYSKGEKTQLANDAPETIVRRVAKTLVDLFYNTGEKLIQILVNHNSAEKLNVAEKTNLKKESERPIGDFEPSIRFIPFYSDRIDGRGALSKNTPFNAIIEILQIFYNLCLAFRYAPLMDFLRKEKEITSKKKSLSSSLVLAKKK